MSIATAGIDHKFGVAFHFLSSQEGETEDGNQTKQQYIQDTYVMNLAKLDDLEDHMGKYDMKDQFMVGVMKEGIDPSNVSHVADLWKEEQRNLFQRWDDISWLTACYWQYSINKRCEGENITSNRWAIVATQNCCTSELRELIKNKYEPIPQHFKGAVTYAWVLCHNLFAHSRDTISSLKKYLKLWESKGLQRIKGENVTIARKEIVAVSRRLNATNSLPDETTIDVLTGLTKCSQPKFREVFKSYLQDATKASLDISESRQWGHNNALGEVEMFMNKALDFYNSLCTGSQWHIPKSQGRFNTC